jgi:two-component system chemotaxis response regulator CheY
LSLRRAKKRSDYRVLIVDDDAISRVVMRSILTQLGFSQLVDAADGARAVAETAKERFDLIVTDYNMPLMNGGNLVTYLKENPATQAVPIIMVTAETDPAKLGAVQQLGLAAICDKNLAPEQMRGIVERLLPGA